MGAGGCFVSEHFVGEIDGHVGNSNGRKLALDFTFVKGIIPYLLIWACFFLAGGWVPAPGRHRDVPSDQVRGMERRKAPLVVFALRRAPLAIGTLAFRRSIAAFWCGAETA